MSPAASPHTVMSPLETTLRTAVSGGRKLLVPYLTGGVRPDWTDYLRAAQRAGADAIEIGLPFSDPTLDGATIQQASDQALRAGATVDSILADLDGMDLSVPLVAMTYANLVLHRGAEDFCRRLSRSGISGLIVPDLPVDEAAQVTRAAQRHGVDLVLLAAPSSPPDRLRHIAGNSHGFVYAMSVMGTTGEHQRMAEGGRVLAGSLKQLTDLPVLLGFGVTDPAQATEASRYADGVIVGSALMRMVLRGAQAEQVGAFVARLRGAVDGAAR